MDWNAAPRDAHWYGEVIFEQGGQITDNYGYCSDPDDYPSPTLLCGPGVVIHEVTVNHIRTGENFESWKLSESKTRYDG